MKFTRNWLEEFIELTETNQKLASDLIALGLEVESLNPVSLAFDDKVITAKIISCEQHPNADKLKVCQVDAGNGDSLQIVCGAPNARADIYVALIQIGGKLQAGGKTFKIKKSKIRGVTSYGMLCSATELGFQDATDGILELTHCEKIGEPLLDLIMGSDFVFDVSLTPNRADCNSLLGIARELSCLYQRPLKQWQPINIANENAQIKTPSVDIDAVDACSQYSLQVFSDIDQKATTSLKYQARLLACGIRCHSPVVDITNYVMLELGQPLHAFDLDTIKGNIHVRFNQKGEKLSLIDGKQPNLPDNTLLIADREQALACAGIMGGKDSEVTTKTQNILLEAAYFHPAYISSNARAIGYQTEASYRFSRGVDPTLSQIALQKTNQILFDIYQHRASSIQSFQSSQYQAHCSRQSIQFNIHQVQSRLGVDIAVDAICKILQGLQFEVAVVGQDAIVCTAPPFRFDIEASCDLLEEIARVYGYDNIPVTPLKLSANQNQDPPSFGRIEKMQNQLVGFNCSEVINYSFVDKEFLNALGYQDLVAIANPMSATQNVMRSSLIPGLLNCVQFNLNRQIKDFGIFEFGQCFSVERGEQSSFQSNDYLGIVLSGHFESQLQQDDDRQANLFYRLKSIVTTLFAEWTIAWVPSQQHLLHPGQSADLYIDDNCIGFCGVIHPNIAKTAHVHPLVAVAEINCNQLNLQQGLKIKAISNYPSIERDLTFDVPNNLTYEQVYQAIIDCECQNLQKVVAFDRYEGVQVKKNCYRLSFSLQFNSQSETLTDKQIDKQIDRVITQLQTQYNIALC